MAPRRSAERPYQKDVISSVPMEISNRITTRGRPINRCLFGRPDPGENQKWLKTFFSDVYNSVDDKWEIIRPLQNKTNKVGETNCVYYLGKPKITPPTPRKCTSDETRAIVKVKDDIDYMLPQPVMEKIRYDQPDIYDNGCTPTKKRLFHESADPIED